MITPTSFVVGSYRSRSQTSIHYIFQIIDAHQGYQRKCATTQTFGIKFCNVACKSNVSLTLARKFMNSVIFPVIAVSGDEIQSLTRILLCGLQSALPKSRELVFPISSYSQALPPIGTAKMLIASKNKYIYCNMTWLDQVYGDVLPGFI